MRDFFKRWRPRGQYRIAISSDAVSVQYVPRSRKAVSTIVERPLNGLVSGGLISSGLASSGLASGGPVLSDATNEADALSAQIAAVIEEAGANGAPLHVTLSDDLVRYFIVTPPANGVRVQDLRAAASVRFQALYGGAAASWHIVADWQAAEPFLACAVSHHVMAAMQIAATRAGGCLVSVTPGFVGAWNRSRKQLGAQVWVATLRRNRLTVGLVGDSPKPRLASVRTLMLPEPMPSAGWLHDQISRIALLDNVSVPTALHLHGTTIDGWQTGRIAVHWHAPDHPSTSDRHVDSGVATPLEWSGAAS